MARLRVVPEKLGRVNALEIYFRGRMIGTE